MRPNILIITIDSLRADKIYGKNKSSLTPNIDALIENGVFFTHTITAGDNTGLSLGSMFTGMYPFKSGITLYSYNFDVVTYFKILKDNGYNTFATVPNLPIVLKLTSNLTERDIYVYDKRESCIQIIINRLQKLKSPWVYYIHLMDLHPPFHLPVEFNSERYGKIRYDRTISSIDSSIGRFLQHIDTKNTLVVISADHGDFIPIIEHWNEPPKINKLLKKIKEQIPALEPLGLKLVVFFNSLRKKYKLNKLKETLTQRQLDALQGRSENSLYDETIRIPLIFSGYGISSSKIISQQVKQVDIFPTILDITNIVSTKNDIDGTSLLPLFNDKILDETPAYIETGARNFKTTKNPILTGKILGVRTSKYKYWRSRVNPQENVTLFDLQNDPDEENNIAHSNPELIESMEQILRDIKGVQQVNQTQFLDKEKDEIEEQLKKLGYI